MTQQEEKLFPIQNLESTVYSVEREVVSGMKALVISDIHFGKIYPTFDTIPLIVRDITTISVENNINCLFILGDIIDFRARNPENIFHGFISALKSLPLSIYIIGGNHDRPVIAKFKDRVNNTNIHIITDGIIRIQHPDPPSGSIPNLFLAHDIYNNFRLTNEEVPQFIRALKVGFNHTIHPEDFLLIGHTHTDYCNKEKRCASIGQFSQESKHRSIAIVTTTNGIEISFAR